MNRSTLLALIALVALIALAAVSAINDGTSNTQGQSQIVAAMSSVASTA